MKWFLNRESFPLSRRSRVLLVSWSLLLLAGFALAAWLEPDPRGFGTHQRLGLPPCSIRLMFGVACPSCGMTTSFAHFVRGQFIQAIQSNFAGFLLALFCAIQIPWCWVSVAQKRLWKVSQPESWLIGVLMVLCMSAAVDWLRRL